MFKALAFLALTYAEFGLPDPQFLAQEALRIAEQRLPEITTVGLSIFIVRRILRNL